MAPMSDAISSCIAMIMLAVGFMPGVIVLVSPCSVMSSVTNGSIYIECVSDVSYYCRLLSLPSNSCGIQL
jgi:hypothetical protein